MLFNSYPFLFVYLPIVFTGFFLLSNRHLVQAAKTWLLAASLIFYAYWDWHYLPLLSASIVFNYQLGKHILVAVGIPQVNFQKVMAQEAARPGTVLPPNSSSLRIVENFPHAKRLLLAGIAVNLSLLFYFKYANFFIENTFGGSLTFAEIILPLGISFFTFTQIAYLVDASRKKAAPSDLISYGLFVTVFPHLIAGPILHHKEMLKQFNSLRMYIFQWPNVAQGIFLFVMGLSKKVILADTLSTYVKPIFDGHFETVPFISAWFGALSYTLQLYFDFSGYSDMAVGLGLLFNLHLPINFNSPYKANSIIDFWRRWHMTLSLFLKDYLYISLGGSRHGKWNHLRNLILTMVLGGLWHGAGWTFILWGALHGAFLVMNHIWRDFHMSLPAPLAKGLTLLAVIVAWVVFRSPDIATAGNILAGMFGFHGIGLPLKYEASLSFLKPIGVFFAEALNVNVKADALIVVFVLALVTLLLPNSNEWLVKFRNQPHKWAIPCVILFVISLLMVDEMAEFIYYQF